MKKIQLFVAIGMAVCTVVVLAQGPRPARRGAHYSDWGRYYYSFQIGERKLVSSIDRENATSTQEWVIGEPLPLTIGRAAEIARRELRVVVTNDTPWDTSQITLNRVGGSSPQSWYYTIRFQPSMSEAERFAEGDFVIIIVDMAGRAGKVGRPD